MNKQSFEQRIVVARVLSRYAAEHTRIDWNRPVLAALEKWIETTEPHMARRAPVPTRMAAGAGIRRVGSSEERLCRN